MKRKIVALLLAALMITAAFASVAAADESALDAIKKRGAIRVGFDTFVPWAMKDKNGEYIGFEIDVAQRVADDLGVKLEPIPTKWDGIIPALLTGKFDVIIGGMGITEERLKKVDFTDPYEFSGMSMMANKKVAGGAMGLEPFNKPELVIVAKMGTTAADAAKRTFPKAELRLFGDEAQCVQEVLNGRAAAFVASAPLPAHQAFKHPNILYVPVEQTFTKEPIGMALRKGDDAFAQYLNGWIAKAEAEGWLNQRWQYWFGGMEWEDRIK